MSVATRIALLLSALILFAAFLVGCGGSGGDQQGTTVIDQPKEKCNG